MILTFNMLQLLVKSINCPKNRGVSRYGQRNMADTVVFLRARTRCRILGDSMITIGKFKSYKITGSYNCFYQVLPSLVAHINR